LKATHELRAALSVFGYAATLCRGGAHDTMWQAAPWK